MGRTRVMFPIPCVRRSIGIRAPVSLKRRCDIIRSFSNKGSRKGVRGLEGETASFVGDGSSERRIVVVVDTSLEAKGALQWALSHSVESQQDTIVLLSFSNNPSSKQGAESNKRAYGLLYSMKNMCQTRRPGVQVEVALVEGKEKGPVIVEAAKQRRATLLVLGQRKRSILGQIRRLWEGTRIRGRAVDYCIQHASCMTVAVRRNGKKLGGYLITTKNHKNFWLLA